MRTVYNRFRLYFSWLNKFCGFYVVAPVASSCLKLSWPCPLAHAYVHAPFICGNQILSPN